MSLRYVQTAAVPTRNTYTQTQPVVETTGTLTASDDASGSSLAAALESFESVLGTVGCTYPAIDAIVTRVEDWLSRQASLSTDTGTTSDYEPVDMSCEVNGEGDDGVFLSPKPTALPSPVVSGASNISDGDLSDDIISPSPSDFGKSLTTEKEDDEGNRLYSPSHPLESGEEECTVEESQLPSPPPCPPQSLLVPSATPPPPSLPPSRVLGDLPPWATGEKQYSESKEKELEKDKHNTSDEKTDIEEAFADQILEEQFSKSAVGSSEGVRHVHSFTICPLQLPDDGEQGNNQATGEDATAQKGKQEETVTRQNKGCLAVTTESQQLMDCSQKSFQHSTDLETTAKEPSHVEMEEEGDTESIQNTVSGEDPHESSGKSEKTRIDDLPSLSPCNSSSSLPATEAATKPESPSEPKTRAKHRSASYRYEMEERTGPSAEDIAGSKSGSSSSPRRSVRHRERSGKWPAASGPASSTRYKSKTDHNTESDESQSSSSRRRHKYETRHRRRSEPEGGESSGKEERRELCYRHKRGSENDSSSERSERRELRPRKGDDKKEDTARGEPKKSRKTREERYKPAKSQQRDPSPYSTSSKRREKTQSKRMVPTMQAFEGESNNQKSTAESSKNLELTAESNEKSGSSAIHKESSVAIKESSETAPLSKQQSEKKRVCEAEEERGEKDWEIKEDECYLRSLSLPPFKVARTSPAGSPTERSLSGSDIQSLSNRSISHSPPSSAVLKKKRPVLTKDELLAMVRAKKKSGLAKGSPNKSPSEQGSESENGTSGERVEATVQSKLDMKKLMFNFHRHMQARKGSDTSWIHPWTVSTDDTSNSPRGAMVPVPHGSTYSLKNPPPPPPGPPPGPPPSSTTFQPSRPGSQQSLPTPVEEDTENVVCAGKNETTSPTEAMEEDEKDATDCKEPSEESLIDSAVESAELQAAEDTLLAVFRDAVGRAVEERIQGEEIFQGRFLDTLEDKIVRENVRKFVDTAVEEKVTELIFAEDVLQERTLDAVEDAISGEIVRFALEEGVGGKVVELIRAENVLQERVLDAVESKIVCDTVAKLTDEEATKESKWLVHSEEILQEEAIKSMQKTVISEMVRKAVGEEIEKKVRETVTSEEFLQERAVSVVESQVLGETAAEALRAAVQEQVFVRIESELVEEATGAIEDVLIHEFEVSVAMEVALEREVCDLVMVEVLGWLLEETEAAVARERVCATEAMVDDVVIHVEQEAGEQLVCECEETFAIGAAMEEMVDEVVATVQGDLIRVATETVAEEAASEQIVLEMENIVSEVLDEFQSHIAFELAQAEEERRDALVENCLRALVETLLRESLSLFSQQLIAEALNELEEKAVENVEEQVLQEALNESEALNELEEKAVENVEEQVLQEALNEAEALNELEEKAVENVEEQVLQEALNEAEALNELEEKAVENVEEQVLQEALNELELAQAEEEQRDALVENCLQALVETLLRESLSLFSQQLIAEALNELEEKAVESVEEQVLQDILQDLVDDIITVDLEIKTAEKLLEAVFSDLLGEVVEEVVNNEERVAEFIQWMVTGIVVEDMLEGTENSLAKEQADKEDDIVLRAEGNISQTVVTELVDTAQGRVAAKITEEKMAEEMEDRAIDNFVSLLLADLLSETANKRVASEEDMVLEAGEVAAKRVEEECLGEAVFSDLLGEVVEEVVNNEERVAEFIQWMVTGIVVKDMLEGTESSLAKEQADKEDDIVLRAEGNISQTVVTELVHTTQGRVAAKITEEKMAEEMEDRAIDNFVSLLLADLLCETANKRVASEEDMVLEAGEVAAKRVEEECLGEVEVVVVKEQAAVGELQEMVLNEIEEEASREEIVREMVADELEKGIIEEMEGEAAAQRAEDKLKSRVAYEVTEVFPDTLATPTTPTYVHVMDAVQAPMEDTPILYEVTEVIPDSVTQLKAETTLPHIHILDSDELTAGGTGQDLLSGSSNEQASTYFIDTPQQAGELTSANDTAESLDKAEQGVTLPPSEVKPKQGTQKRDQPEDSPMTSPGPSFSPPPLAVLNPLLPKYISRRLQLRPLKYFPPPDGVRRPTPLPLGSSTQTADETPPSEQDFKQDGGNLRSASPRSRVRGRGWRSTRARRSGRRNSSGYRQPTAAERELRPRTRSQSCSSTHSTLDPPTSPLIAPSPTQLTELALFSIQVTDQLATSPIHPTSDAPTPARRGRPRGRPPKSSSRYHSRAALSRRGSRSCRMRSEDPSKSPHPPREMSLIVCVPHFSKKRGSLATSEKESVTSEKEPESVEEVAGEAKESTGGSTPQENDDVFMEVEYSGPHELPSVQPSLESDLPASPVATEVSSCMELKEIVGQEVGAPESEPPERTVANDDPEYGKAEEIDESEEAGITLVSPQDPTESLGTETMAPYEGEMELHKEDTAGSSPLNQCQSPQLQSDTGHGYTSEPEVGDICTSFLDEDEEEHLQAEATTRPVTEAEAIETESTTKSATEEKVAASEGSSIEEMLTGARTSAEGYTGIECLTDDSCPGLTTGSLTTEDKATALESCIGVTSESLSQYKAYPSESATTDPIDSLAEDKGFPSEGCTNLTTESLTMTEDRATDSESCNNEDTASERKNSDISLLDLPSTSPVSLDSPQASPATGVSFSTATSPHSVNEEDMLLRLEASFSSAPETDSDQEAELDLMIVKGTKEEESQLNAQGTTSESSSLGESGGKADRETEELSTEWKVSTGCSSTTKDSSIGDLHKMSAVSVSIANPTASLGHSDRETGAKPLENKPILEESGSTSVPEDTLVSEQASVLGGTDTVSVETGPSERVPHLPDAVTLVLEQAVIDSVLGGSDTVSENVPHLSNPNPPLSHLPSSSLLDKIPTTSLSPPSPPPLPPLPPSPPPPPPPPATRNFNDSRPPWATAEMLAISSEGEESMDLASDAEGLSSSEEPVETLDERQNKTPPDHTFLVIKMNRGKDTEVSKVASSPPSVPVLSSTDFTNQSESQSLLTQRTSPQPPQSREHVPSTEIPVLQTFSCHPRTLSISQDLATESVPARSSPPSSSKNKSSPVSDEELLDLLSSAHQEFMSAPIPHSGPKPSSKAPSPSEVPTNLPVTQPPVSLGPGNLEGLPFETFRETSTSTSSRETTPEASTKKAKQRSASDSLWQSFSDSKSNPPLPLSSQPQMSHSPVVGKGGGVGILGRAPRQYHHSVPGVYPYPSRPLHVYRSRNPDHLWSHIYPYSAPPQVEPPGLPPFPAHPMTPPPHYALPHTPPLHGPYSLPPNPYSFPPSGVPPPLHPSGSSHPYGHYMDQRHRYRPSSRYRSPFDY